jgi:hypothetical protein
MALIGGFLVGALLLQKQLRGFFGVVLRGVLGLLLLRLRVQLMRSLGIGQHAGGEQEEQDEACRKDSEKEATHSVRVSGGEGWEDAGEAIRRCATVGGSIRQP